MSAATFISGFTPKSIPHIAGSAVYIAVPGVSLGIGAARTAYAVRNLIHQHKIQKQMGDILGFLDDPEGQDRGYDGVRECLNITMPQKQGILQGLKDTGKYTTDERLKVALNTACVNTAKAASKRTSKILLKELFRGLSEIFFPFVGPLLWTRNDLNGGANLFGCHQILESYKWNHELYPLAQRLEHPKEL